MDGFTMLTRGAEAGAIGEEMAEARLWVTDIVEERITPESGTPALSVSEEAGAGLTSLTHLGSFGNCKSKTKIS